MQLCQTYFLLLALFTAVTASAEPEERLILDSDTDDCTLFRALNGSEAVSDECQDDDDSKLAFVPAKPPQTVELRDLAFDSSSSRLSGASQAYLARLAKAMRDPSSQSQVYSIDGHTDPRGDPGNNLMLSARRALAVRDFLIEQGVSATRLHVRAFGATKLLDPQHPDALANRRVDVNNLR